MAFQAIPGLGALVKRSCRARVRIKWPRVLLTPDQAATAEAPEQPKGSQLRIGLAKSNRASSRRPKACSLRSHCFGFPRCARPRLTANVRCLQMTLRLPNYWRLPIAHCRIRIRRTHGKPPLQLPSSTSLARAATMPQMRSAYLGCLRTSVLVSAFLDAFVKPFRRMIVSVPSTRRYRKLYSFPAACSVDTEFDDYVRLLDRLGTPRAQRIFVFSLNFGARWTGTLLENFVTIVPP